MKTHRKISTIRILMIISQILLTVFLGYWLYTQFTDQKQLLSKEIKRGFLEAENQAIDSMLANNLINPILNDSINIKLLQFDTITTISHSLPDNYYYNHDSVYQKITRVTDDDIEVTPDHKFPGQIKEIGISITDSCENPNIKSFTIHTKQDTGNKLLLQSVRLLINSVNKYVPDESNLSTFFYANADTALLKRLFDEFIETNYWGLSINWQSSDEMNASNSGNSGIRINCSMCEGVSVYITKYQIFLLKSISPQIVFAILLLIITAVAFRMAYSNLKDQLKLIVIKNDFISNITHELKTPVSTVKVALEALLDFDRKKDPQRTKEYLEMALSEMNRLDLLVNQVLNNSALEEGNKFIMPESIDLKIIVDEVINSMKPSFEKQEAKINFESAGSPIIVDADSLHIHGVLVNLIDNSLKYSLTKANISIKLSQNEKETILTIDDNGIGIPNEYIDKVFDKFFRVPNKDKHNVKGYGLGLNYAALVMQQHQGTISVKNLDKRGCRFTLTLPTKCNEEENIIC